VLDGIYTGLIVGYGAVFLTMVRENHRQQCCETEVSHDIHAIRHNNYMIIDI
jgi:hypothetical protein